MSVKLLDAAKKYQLLPQNSVYIIQIQYDILIFKEIQSLL